MIEIRKFTEQELNSLLETAPDTETRNLKAFLKERGFSAYDFFNKNAIDYFGLLSNGRPLYLAVLTRNEWTGDYEFWTVVNSNIKETFSLCKYCKRGLKDWIKKYRRLYATMEKVNPLNIKWVKWLGFKPIREDDKTITFCLQGGKIWDVLEEGNHQKDRYLKE